MKVRTEPHNYVGLFVVVVGLLTVFAALDSTAPYGGATAARAAITAPRGNGLDSSFGKNGVARLPNIAPHLRTRIQNCVPLTNGSVLALATAESLRGGYGSSIPYRDFIVKFTRRGKRATNFAENGLFMGPRRSSHSIQSLSLDSFERPLVLMRRSRGTARGQLKLIRLTEQGRVDHTFGRRANGTVPLKGRFARWGQADIFPLKYGRVILAVATRDDQTRLIVLNRSGAADRRFSGDGRATVALRGVAATELRGGDIAVAGTVKTDAGRKLRVIRLRRNGAQRLDWAQGGVHEIAAIPAAALPPDISEVDANRIIGRLSVQDVILMTAQMDGGLLLGVVSSDEDEKEIDIEWLRRLSNDGNVDSTFGSNGNVFGQFETMFDGEQTQVNQFQLLPASHGETLALTLNNPTDHTLLSGSIIDAFGHANALPVWGISFDEDFSYAKFAKPQGPIVIGCGTAESIAGPRRLESYLFAVKLPSG